jgi:retron-type reverse transcriptase
VSNIILRESEQTSLWSFHTRELGQPAEEGRQMTATRVAGATSHETTDWQALDWHASTRTVRRLQARIVQAIQARRWGKVKALQHLLTHSFSAKVLAIRRVTENPGKRTPGVDRILGNTPEKKAAAIPTLRQRGYRAQPLRRVLIPKPNGKMRPLGISTLRDRAMQALYLFALDPIAETTGDPNSYGFRPQRCTADAIEQCRLVLSRKTSAQWVLEADIKSCFDEISHEWLLTHIPMEKAVLRQWLKAGIMTNGAWQPTDAGTPQGNIASPVLCNLTLNGLERVLSREHLTTRQRQAGLINLVRWADEVRHITWRQIPFTERRGTEDKTSGSTTDLEAKAEGDSSMSLKRRTAEGVYAVALQDPRDTGRARLPKPQFPAMEANILWLPRLLTESSRSAGKVVAD